MMTEKVIRCSPICCQSDGFLFEVLDVSVWKEQYLLEASES
jgi:hypothetical protein